MLNYHELTMTEPRDSPARRKQFLIICAIMGSVFTWSVISAGLFQSVQVTDGVFEGGDYFYKSTKRDYAAAPSLESQIAKDAGIKESQTVDKIFSVFLDNPNAVFGRDQRFACGVLNQDLLHLNDEIIPPTRQEVADLPAMELWPKLRYKTASFPKSKALVVNFPYTNGFVSSLIYSYKILPRLYEVAASKTDNVVVITTCSSAESMCTVYVPTENVESFLLGQLGHEAYLKSLPREESLGDELRKSIKKAAKKYLGLGFHDEL